MENIGVHRPEAQVLAFLYRYLESVAQQTTGSPLVLYVSYSLNS